MRTANLHSASFFGASGTPNSSWLRNVSVSLNDRSEPQLLGYHAKIYHNDSLIVIIV